MNRIVSIVSLSLALLTAAPAFALDDNPNGMVEVATCKDGKTFYSKSLGRDGKPSHAGACRAHGGVAKWADGSPVKSHERKTEYK